MLYQHLKIVTLPSSSNMNINDGMGYKTLWKKEKMLVTNIFCFFNNVFKILPPRGR